MICAMRSFCVTGPRVRLAHVAAYYVTVVGAVAMTLVFAGYLYPHFVHVAPARHAH